MIFKKVDAEKLVFKEYNSMMAITKAVGITIGPLINKVANNWFVNHSINWLS